MKFYEENVKSATNKSSDLSSTAVEERNQELYSIESFLLYPITDVILTPSLEAEEDTNPFEGIGDEAFEEGSDSGNDTFGSDNDNTFDTADDDFDFGSDDDSFDFGGDDEEKKKKSKDVKREDLINKKFDLSKIVRKEYPDHILKLTEVILENIGIVEKEMVSIEFQEQKNKIVQMYRDLLDIMYKYISNMNLETYDSIFKNYLNFWKTSLDLKNASIKLLNYKQ